MVDVACATLQRKIIDNDLPPGFQALEEELALQLGMSRTPVREALIRLENEGWIVVVPRKGMRVKPLSIRDILEVDEVLACLEAEAAERLALRRPSPEEMARLERSIADLDWTLDAEDMRALADADYQFHFC